MELRSRSMPESGDPPAAERFGAVLRDDGTVGLAVWAPVARTLDVHAGHGATALERGDDGVYRGTFRAGAGDHYLLVLDGEATCPDPGSRFQPHGVRGPSEVVDSGSFAWTDSAWTGPSLDDLVLYELHIGTFTEDGTFDAVIPRLAGL